MATLITPVAEEFASVELINLFLDEIPRVATHSLYRSNPQYYVLIAVILLIITITYILTP